MIKMFPIKLSGIPEEFRPGNVLFKTEPLQVFLHGVFEFDGNGSGFGFSRRVGKIINCDGAVDSLEHSLLLHGSLHIPGIEPEGIRNRIINLLAGTATGNGHGYILRTDVAGFGYIVFFDSLTIQKECYDFMRFVSVPDQAFVSDEIFSCYFCNHVICKKLGLKGLKGESVSYQSFRLSPSG